MKSRTIILAMILIVINFSCADINIKEFSKNNYKIVQLPDGSIAYLNSNSHIEYNKYFKKRIVKQYGEVFYDVTKGDTSFIVETELGDIQVIGTKFNVKSSLDELELEVEEGIVELKTSKFIRKVKKGQKAIFEESENSFKMYKAEFKHEKWIKNLDKEIKKLGIELNKDLKQIDRESKKSWKEVKREFKNL